MSASARPNVIPFVADAVEGLAMPTKRIDSRYLFDEIGASLFETIRLLPEYGMERAEERLFKRYLGELARLIGPVSSMAELGAREGKSMSYLRRALGKVRLQVEDGLRNDAVPIWREWLERAAQAVADGPADEAVVLTLSRGAIGDLDRTSTNAFLHQLKSTLRRGDRIVVSADLVKGVDKMIAAYDDPTGVVAAFNKNVLGRFNRELGGRFDIRRFDHTVQWNSFQRQVEFHLRSTTDQEVYVAGIGRRVPFVSGETIHTASFRKFSELELETVGEAAGFNVVKSFIDIEWAFAAVVWAV